MATELKPCEKCGGRRVQEVMGERSHRVMCWDCGYSCSAEYWNTRAMPECVRAILAATERVADPNGDIRTARAAVNKYYGEGGE